MATFSLWFIGQLFLLIGVVDGIDGRLAQGPISFRSRYSALKYVFPKTETLIQTDINLAFSTPKCTGNILTIPSRDVQHHYYKLTLKSSKKLVFDYQILDGKFTVTLNATRSFCDGRIHYVSLRKQGRKVTYQVNEGKMISHVGKRFIQKASISKPDGIFIGGTRKDKFIGCLYNASVAIHWTGNLPITELDLVHMYARGDPNVSGKDLFVGACANRNAECVSRNKLYLTRAIGWISSPFNPKEVKRCTWVLIASRSRRVKLELHRLRVNNSNSCINNQVRVMEGQTDGRQVIGRYCNPNLQSPIVLYSNGRYLTVVLENLQSDDTVDFFAKYTMTSLSEGPCPVFKDVTSSSGIITSPDFPYIYGNSKKCTWRIRVPHGKHVLITFKRKDFKVDGCSDDCRCDYLGISTSIKHGIKSKYCGTSPPSPIYSRQSVVRMDFISDSKYSHQGFKATYTAVSSLEDQCPSYKELHTYSGTITSPRYPLPYPGEVDCFWIIKSPPNSRIDLTFSKPINLDINCTDFVEVTDSAIKRHQTFMVTLCNSTELPATFSTYNRKLIVRFVSDKYQRMTWSMKSGFKAEYKILLMAALQTGSSVVQHTILSSSWIFLFLILHTIVLN